jgi:glycosyltransferase involved in cell wall biosynthesis
MKILLIMDPGLPVPPPLYGGHERLVHLFAEEYHRLGHEVSLLVGPDSKGPGKVYSFGRNGLNRPKWENLKEIFSGWSFLARTYKQYDMIHNFGRLIYLLPVLNRSVKKIMSYGRKIYQPNISIANKLPTKNLIFTACSNHCVSTGNVAGKWATVYNAIDFSKYSLQIKIADDAPLIFLGRLDKIKGVHNAIKVAKTTGNKLVIAGNIPETADNLDYYKTQLEPQFDGEQICYVGPVNDAMKSKYLGQAKALLFPIEWDEPFGLVMIEAMACGTPVIGFNRGSVPEVITATKNGFTVKNIDEMCSAVQKIETIDREICRDTAFSRFNVQTIAKQYLDLFNDN